MDESQNETQSGLVHLRSKRSVAETVAALETIVRSRGASVVARVDHALAASDAGLSMRPTLLLIFGNATMGTPLMVAAPSVAIDLPLKALAWEDANGCVWLTYNDPHFLQQRHGFPEPLIKNIQGVQAMCEEAVRSHAS
ncbi:MAG TPA: DUF302 domain-containing protein [Acidobacteriaceae bacterium]